MRKVKRWKYYCEFCKKSGGHPGYMRKHEFGCTMNPKRVCGMCRIIGNPQQKTESLIAIVNKYVNTTIDEDYGGFISVQGNTEAMLKELEDITDNCPACTMAAIRQAGVPISATNFDYKDACKEFWDAYNEGKSSEYY